MFGNVRSGPNMLGSINPQQNLQGIQIKSSKATKLLMKKMNKYHTLKRKYPENKDKENKCSIPEGHQLSTNKWTKLEESLVTLNNYK